MKKDKFLDKVNKMLDIEACQALLSEMSPLLLKAKIEERTIKSLIKNNVNKEESDKIQQLRRYLLNLFEREYSEYKKAYKVLPPEAWENYELMGIEDMPEQIHLNKKMEQLKDIWKKRPRKTKKV